MQGVTWAAIAAGDKVQSHTSTAAPTTQTAPPYSVLKENGNSTDSTKLYAGDIAPAENAQKHQDVDKSAKSGGNAASFRKSSRKNNLKKKKKAVRGTMPLYIDANNSQKLAAIAEPFSVEAPRMATASKKQKASADADKAKAVDTPVQKTMEKHSDPVGTSALGSSDAATASTKKKKNNKLSKNRKKAKAAENAIQVTDGEIVPQKNIAKLHGQNISTSTIRELATANGAVTQVAPAGTDSKSVEDDQLITYAHTFLHLPETAVMPGSLVGGPLPAISHVLESLSLQALHSTRYSHKYSDSAQVSTRAERDAPIAQAHSMVPQDRRSRDKDVKRYIQSLRIPGISHDKHGVCIAPDAPEWVRGRIVRRVQCIVDELGAGITNPVFDEATELELEKKEKAHFDKATWDRLFKIDPRGPTIGAEKLVLDQKLQEFGEEMAAGIVPDVPATVTKEEVDDNNFIEKVAEEPLSLPLPKQRKVVQQKGSEQKSIQQIFGGLYTAQQSPYFQLTSQLTLPAQTFLLAPQVPVEDVTNGYRSAEPFVLAQSLQQHRSDTPQRHPQEYNREPCRNYARGYCSYGDECRFVHVQPHEPQSQHECWSDRQDSAYGLIGFSLPG